MLSNLKFIYPFRTYQDLILAQIAECQKKGDTKFHIVAPPGSGKTIIGLEFIRRSNQKAVVFAPTTTIQHQWKDKLKMFVPENESIDDYVSLVPQVIKSINIFTYQLLSSPAENLQFVEESALFCWQEELVNSRTEPTFKSAKERILQIKKNNPLGYSKELGRHYKRLKTQLFQDKAFDRTQFLHPNARKLIQNLIDSGVTVVVMDEAHHLLDYWAIIIQELLRKIKNPFLLGLTATPPYSATEQQMSNYLQILGEVDYEIPTPAVIKEGNLAPFQDLVFFCQPSKRENEFIHSLQTQFNQLVNQIGVSQNFKEWIHQKIVLRYNEYKKTIHWTEFYHTQPALAVAGVKYLQQCIGLHVPENIIVIEEMLKPISFDDWLVLLEDYALKHLKVSPAKTDHAYYQQIQTVLKSFGFVLSEQGIRQYRAPADLIMAFSQSKADSTVTILHTEMQAMKDELRVLIVTDREKQSPTALTGVKDILDKEAGGAVQVLRTLVHDPIATQLEPILATGTSVLIDSDEVKIIVQAMNNWKKAQGYEFDLIQEPTDTPKIFRISGVGKDWKSSVYVRMITALFEAGVTKCIVGTRGIFGEGWDSLKINTLIDLTTATTSTAVNQLRGRTIRIDPSSPRKFANNWDIVCMSPTFERGDNDFKRFLKKHEHFYGLGEHGKIVKGYLHIDENLGLEYESIGFKQVKYAEYNRKMLAKSMNRSTRYDEWQVGKPYRNNEISALKMDRKDILFRSVYRVRTIAKHIFLNIMLQLSILGGMLYFAAPFMGIVFGAPLLGIPVMALPIALSLIIWKNIIRWIKQMNQFDTGAEYIIDVAHALLISLQKIQAVHPSITFDNIQTWIDEKGYLDVYLENSNSHDAKVFSQAMTDIFSPVTSQRYLISRSTERLYIPFFDIFWKIGHSTLRHIRNQKTQFYPVPNVFAQQRKQVDIFVRYWKYYVGGDQVVYTRSDLGEQKLLQIRSSVFQPVKKIHYDLWT